MRLILIASLIAYTGAQSVSNNCTLPAPFANGSTYHGNFGPFVNVTSSQQLIWYDFSNIYPQNFRFYCDYAVNGTYVGRKAWGPGFMAVCFSMTSSSSPYVFGLGFRSAWGTSLGFSLFWVHWGSSPSAPPFSVACNHPTPGPHLETVFIHHDIAGNYVPSLCPWHLQRPFTSYVVDPYTTTPQCGTAGGGMYGNNASSQITFNTPSCGPLATFLSGVSILYCLHEFSHGGESYFFLSNSTAFTKTFYCASYSASDGRMNLTIAPHKCDQFQTSTSLGNSTGIVLGLTYDVPTNETPPASPFPPEAIAAISSAGLWFFLLLSLISVCGIKKCCARAKDKADRKRREAEVEEIKISPREHNQGLLHKTPSRSKLVSLKSIKRTQ